MTFFLGWDEAMQTYRMWITFNDGIKPYHNRYTVFISDREALDWIKNYASRYEDYYWYEFIEYLLINIKTGQKFKGKVTK